MDSNRKRNASEIDGDFTNDEIKTIVEEIVTDTGYLKDKERIFRNKYSCFAERYPMLFKMACSSDFDKDRFSYILEMMERVKSKEISYDNATKQFGQEMFDSYIKPTLDKAKRK